MKDFTALCGAALMALLLTGCSQTSPDTREADAKALRDNETQWNQDFASKDVDKLIAHYADNAVLMVPGMPASSGKDAIRKTLTEMLADPALSLKFQSSRVETAKSGDIAYTQGTYTMTMTDPNSKQVVNDHGSYVTTYSKQPDGSWKAVADIATSEVPPAAPPSPAAKKK
ncbi:MAG: SgcJ/EcaC family oxidoreductase [Acidobacteriia bacterium]|nr:SgcJ/EcaC family oxidoreductase [Terriglobia bacterium]